MIDTGNNAGSMRYAKKVIISWLEKGIMAMDQLRIYKARWESRILRFVMKMSPNMLCKKLSGILIYQDMSEESTLKRLSYHQSVRAI